jgi:hypothetical protein
MVGALERKNDRAPEDQVEFRRTAFWSAFIDSTSIFCVSVLREQECERKRKETNNVCSSLHSHNFFFFFFHRQKKDNKKMSLLDEWDNDDDDDNDDDNDAQLNDTSALGNMGDMRRRGVNNNNNNNNTATSSTSTSTKQHNADDEFDVGPSVDAHGHASTTLAVAPVFAWSRCNSCRRTTSCSWWWRAIRWCWRWRIAK